MLPNFKTLFPELTDDSRVWLYLANRKLDPTELQFAEEQLSVFLTAWKAHGKQLNCNGSILFSQYLILVVNEEVESASGCSIDSSVHFVKSLGNELEVEFFNRLNVLKFVGDTDTETSNYFTAMNGVEPFLNPLIQNLGELRNNWLVTPKV